MQSKQNSQQKANQSKQAGFIKIFLILHIVLICVYKNCLDISYEFHIVVTLNSTKKDEVAPFLYYPGHSHS